MAWRVSIGVAGFGLVGREFVRLLVERRSWLAEREGVSFTVAFIADSRGAAVDCKGLPYQSLTELLSYPRGGVSKLPTYGRPGASVGGLLEECTPDILVDVTPSRYDNPSQLGWALKTLGYGGAVVFADKAPLATACGRLLSGSWASRVFYKATVMAGTPLIDVLRYGLLGRRLVRLTGALNTTSNYILWLASKGLGFDEAVRRAQEEGYAEPNPELDLKGVDLAAKAAIVSCTLGFPITLRDVTVESQVDRKAVELAAEAARSGGRARYVAIVEPGGRARVRLEVYQQGSSLYEGGPAENVAVIETEETQPIVLRGPGAGARATAASLLSDVVAAARALRGG